MAIFAENHPQRGRYSKASHVACENLTYSQP